MTIAYIQEEIINEFEQLGVNAELNVFYMVCLGKNLPRMPATHKRDARILRTTTLMTTVWIAAEFRNGKLFYHGDSDSLIVKGLLSLALRIYSGHTPEDVLNAKFILTDAPLFGSAFGKWCRRCLHTIVTTMRTYAHLTKVQTGSLIDQISI